MNNKLVSFDRTVYMRVGKRSCTRFFLFAGIGVIKTRALCSTKAPRSPTGKANESNFADFQSPTLNSVSFRFHGNVSFSLQIKLDCASSTRFH